MNNIEASLKVNNILYLFPLTGDDDSDLSHDPLLYSNIVMPSNNELTLPQDR